MSNGGSRSVNVTALYELNRQNEEMFVLTTNNNKCRNANNEDCWNEQLIMPIVSSRRYLLQLQNQQHRDYLKVLFSQTSSNCVQTCVDKCDCDCSLDVTKTPFFQRTDQFCTTNLRNR